MAKTKAPATTTYDVKLVGGGIVRVTENDKPKRTQGVNDGQYGAVPIAVDVATVEAAGWSYKTYLPGYGYGHKAPRYEVQGHTPTIGILYREVPLADAAVLTVAAGQTVAGLSAPNLPPTSDQKNNPNQPFKP